MDAPDPRRPDRTRRDGAVLRTDVGPDRRDAFALLSDDRELHVHPAYPLWASPDLGRRLRGLRPDRARPEMRDTDRRRPPTCTRCGVAVASHRAGDGTRAAARSDGEERVGIARRLDVFAVLRPGGASAAGGTDRAAHGFGVAPYLSRSLGPRSVGDQALVTGVVTALSYATTVTAQEALAALAATRGSAAAPPGGGPPAPAGANWSRSRSRSPWAGRCRPGRRAPARTPLVSCLAGRRDRVGQSRVRRDGSA